MRSILYTVILTLFLTIGLVDANPRVSLAIPAFAKECIYYDLQDDDHTLLIAYQVLYGGDFELDFEITSPKGETIIEQKNEKFADFLLKTFGLGEYSFCFSNPYNQLKKVEFSIKLESTEEEERILHDKDTIVSEHTLLEIDRNIGKIDRILNYLRAREWRNMSTVQSTESRVVYLSWIIIGITVTISLGQAFIVQFLFTDRNRTYV
ncbi:hypothetical protein WICMUC_002211 [Wickerhamomyces mucosus]|uniref:GOLD domain-containing protein n=1 Tax=Wickerhamomyces mucosus TaxID=1378264 RepID=A0A9P8TEU6_9ASCO|nr:hypothetical protein WICMUC_002211 [Wickerhamomyces mucosus]